tara:strand:- start:143 stop:541 length:399 start_codon:yes stop_codon:yes gene_type:complete
MINSKIIRLASNTKFAGLKNIFTHKSSVKNSLCGDFIKVEIIANKTKIKSMRYQTESCVICEASASLLANKIKNFNLKDLKDNYKLFNKRGEIGFSSKFKIFNQLLTGKNKSRINCVILPVEALFKALKISK